jgi:hypothetical protein
VIGCNVAWGIIDGALYIVGQLFDRGRSRKLGMAVRASADKSAAAALVADELDPVVSGVLNESERATLYGRIAENIRQKPAAATRVGKEDWMGAFTSFWLVVITSAPAAIPFLLFDDARFALRVSNGILLGLLFLSGYWWSRYTLGKPWLTGIIFLLGGGLLVLAAIALGG